MPDKKAMIIMKMSERETCHDCGVKEGELHQPGCDMERCPFCGGQLITCDCMYKKLGLYEQYKKWGQTVAQGNEKKNLFPRITGAQFTAWCDSLETKGRIPFIMYPNLCARCGRHWPDMFSVPNEEWERYVEPSMRREMLCQTCFVQVKTWIDGRPPSKKYLQRLQDSVDRMQAAFEKYLSMDEGGKATGGDAL
jgi:hypothetical protein